jgi:ribonuclease J
MFAVETGGRIIVIDCGLSFPNDEMLGVDLVLPDWSYLTERADACEAVVLTHGHEDHVGALSWFLRDVDVPVYGTPLTLGIARRRLDEFGVHADMRVIEAPGTLTLGPFDLTFLAVSHSIPDAISVAITTPDGTIYYTGDFKFEQNPIDGRHTDEAGIEALGDRGIDLMLSDSTNVERPGRTPSEEIVGRTLKDIIGGARGRVLVACFASNLHRVQQVCTAAEEAGRKVAFVGRSMVNNVEVGRELGHLRMHDSTIIPIDQLGNHAPETTVICCTGSQGEPLAALSLIAAGDHKSVRVFEGDTVILSASPIPGNEAAVHRVINGLYKAGAEVHNSETSAVHVSGHGASEELAHMIKLARPTNFIPVHGEYRHLALHQKLAEAQGIDPARIELVEDGDVIELAEGRMRRSDPIQAGMILVDGLGVGDVGPIVLRDRRLLAQDGVIFCVVTIDAHSGEILAGPDLITRGFVHEDQNRDLLDEASDVVLDALESLKGDEVTEWGSLKKTMRRALGSFVWEQTRRRPMILPVIMET